MAADARRSSCRRLNDTVARCARLAERGVAHRTEGLLDLTTGLARAAEGSRLLAELFKFGVFTSHIRMLKRIYDILSGGGLNMEVH